MKNGIISSLTLRFVFTTVMGLFTFNLAKSQTENRYFDGETVGAKGTVDNGTRYLVSTGAVQKACPDSVVNGSAWYAYVLRTISNGSMVGSATYIGDGEHDYYGTDIEVIDDHIYYVVGYTNKGQVFPGIFDQVTGQFRPYYNAFVAKVDFINPANNWIKVIGDSLLNDQAFAVCVDPDDVAYITGVTNEKFPCVQGSTENCNSGCYSTGDVLFVSCNVNGTLLINSRLGEPLNWAKGNDILFAGTKVYLAITYSNSVCSTGYTTSAGAISFDPVTGMFSNSLLNHPSNQSMKGNGLGWDNNQTLIMVGDITHTGRSYTWGFDLNLMQRFYNEFIDTSGSFEFKAITYDTLCERDTIIPDSSIINYRYFMISGDRWTNNRILSHMMTLRIHENNLVAPIPGGHPHTTYIYEYSKNSNIAYIPGQCGVPVTQTLDLAVFGHCHNNFVSNKNSYVVVIKHSGRSYCDNLHGYTYHDSGIILTETLIQDTLIDLLDTIYTEFQGMNHIKFCDFQFGPAPLDSESGNPESTQHISGYSLYPNPASDILNIERSTVSGNCQVLVYNNTGQLVKISQFQPNSNSLLLQTSDMHNGIYFVKIDSEGQDVTFKVVIQD